MNANFSTNCIAHEEHYIGAPILSAFTPIFHTRMMICVLKQCSSPHMHIKIMFFLVKLFILFIPTIYRS